MQDFKGRGWSYIDTIVKELRKRMKIKDVLTMMLEEERIEPASKGYHLPGTYNCGRKRAATPDYWEYGYDK